MFFNKVCYFVGAVVVGGLGGLFLANVYESPRPDVLAMLGVAGGGLFSAYTLGKAA